MPSYLNLSFVRGDDWKIEITRQASGGTPIDITGYAYRWSVRDDAGVAIVATQNGSIVSAVDGILELTLARAVTELIVPWHYKWDLEETASGVRTTILAGDFCVLEDQTHS